MSALKSKDDTPKLASQIADPESRKVKLVKLINLTSKEVSSSSSSSSAKQDLIITNGFKSPKWLR